jgi:hypothetical protein
MVIYVAAKIGILQGWGIDWVSKYGYFKTVQYRYGRGAFYFCRNKSNKNAFFFLGFFAAQAFALQIRQNHGLQKVAPLRSLVGPRFSKYLLCPLPPHRATIVLPDFIRSELQIRERKKCEKGN